MFGALGRAFSRPASRADSKQPFLPSGAVGGADGRWSSRSHSSRAATNARWGLKGPNAVVGMGQAATGWAGSLPLRTARQPQPSACARVHRGSRAPSVGRHGRGQEEILKQRGSEGHHWGRRNPASQDARGPTEAARLRPLGTDIMKRGRASGRGREQDNRDPGTGPPARLLRHNPGGAKRRSLATAQRQASVCARVLEPETSHLSRGRLRGPLRQSCSPSSPQLLLQRAVDGSRCPC
jgi:hypothetical protein